VKAVNDGLVRPDERIVVLATGNGLKDVASAMKSVEQVGTRAHVVEKSMDDVRQAVEGIGGVPSHILSPNISPSTEAGSHYKHDLGCVNW